MRMGWLLAIIIPAMLTGCQARSINFVPASPSSSVAYVNLPTPRLVGPLSLEESLNSRRSVREYNIEPLTLLEVSQLLWAAQGITGPLGVRTAPSAGALYPLEIYLVAGNVKDLPAGIYHYKPVENQLALVKTGDQRQELSTASLNQKPVADGAIDLVIYAVYERTTQKYGEKGRLYADLEAGHAAQNILLQAVALGLGAVTVGDFDDRSVENLLNLAEGETPLYVIPVGHPQR